jgi:hypothetical protein
MTPPEGALRGAGQRCRRTDGAREQHLADEVGLEQMVPEEHRAGHHPEEPPRHVVDITAEGFQVLDTWTDALRADVWGSRGQAQGACDQLNGCAGSARDGDPG